MQHRLLAESALTLTKAIEFDQNMETADCNARALKGSKPAISKINSRQIKGSNTSQLCYRCGKPNHSNSDCRFNEVDVTRVERRAILHQLAGPNQRAMPIPQLEEQETIWY